MSILQHNIAYHLYIEGVRVPVSNLTVSNTVNQGVKLSAELAAFPEALKLTRGMKIMLFKQLDNQIPKLRFFGLLVSKFYNKSNTKRMLTIECASFSYRLATLKICQLNDSSLSSSDNLVLTQNKYSDATAKNSLFLTGGGIALTSTASSSGTLGGEQNLEQKRAYENTNNVLLGIEYKEVTSVDVAKQIRNNASLDIAENKKLPAYYTQTVVGRFKAASDKYKDYMKGVIELLNTAILFSNPYAYKECMECHLGDMLESFPIIDKQTYSSTFLDPNSSVAKETLNNKEEKEAEESGIKIIKPTSKLTAVFAKKIDEFIKSAAAPIPIMGVVKYLSDLIFYEISEDPLKIDKSILLHPFTSSFIPPKCNVIFPSMYNSISFGVDDWNMPTRTLVSFPTAFQGDSTVYTNVPQAEVGIVISDSDDPFLAQIGKLNRSNWDALKKHEEDQNKKIKETQEELERAERNNIKGKDVAPGEDGSYLNKPLPEDITPKTNAVDILEKFSEDQKQEQKETDDFYEEQHKAAMNKFSAMASILSDEEVQCGVIANVQSISDPSFSNLSGPDKLHLADFLHHLARYSLRSCEIRGALIDNVAVGMPVLIIDDEYSIHGVLESVQYSASSTGMISSNLVIKYPKFILLDEALPKPPVWIGTELSTFEKIGEAYKKIYGCDSIYDKELDSKQCSLDYTETYNLAIMTARIINEYNSASNKELFSNNYRQRAELDINTVMKSIFKCVPEKYNPKQQENVEVWSGPMFAAYDGIGDVPKTAVTPEMKHVATNKQDIVLKYTNRLYDSSSGVKPGVDAMPTKTIKVLGISPIYKFDRKDQEEKPSEEDSEK